MAVTEASRDVHFEIYLVLEGVQHLGATVRTRRLRAPKAAGSDSTAKSDASYVKNMNAAER